MSRSFSITNAERAVRMETTLFLLHTLGRVAREEQAPIVAQPVENVNAKLIKESKKEEKTAAKFLMHQQKNQQPKHEKHDTHSMPNHSNGFRRR